MSVFLFYTLLKNIFETFKHGKIFLNILVYTLYSNKANFQTRLKLFTK